MKNKKGFTLLEIVITLVLVGILASAAGAGFVSATRGYIFTRDLNIFTQKTQATMARVGKILNNMTGLTSSAANKAAVTYLRNNNSITEEFFLDKPAGSATGTLQSKMTGGSTLGLPDNTYALQDDIKDFQIDYHILEGDQEWSPTPPALADIAKLALIRVRLTMDVDGEDLTFTNAFMPRNTFIHEGFRPNALGSGSEGNGIPDHCFVATAAYGDLNSPIVILLRKFRDSYLLTWDGGKQLVAWYYEHGPTAANYIADRPILRTLSKGFLYPVAGFAYLTMLHPLALLLIPFIIFCTRYFYRKHLPSAQACQSGGALLGIIASILFMSVLSAGMVHMYSSTAMATVGYSLSPKAYYMAESGLRFAARQYNKTMANASNVICDAIETVNDEEFTITTSDNEATAQKFSLEVKTYWFELPADKSLTFNSSDRGHLPAEISPRDTGGVLYLSGSKKAVEYSKIEATDDGVKFVPVGAIPAGATTKEQVLFAGNMSATTLKNGDDINIGTEAIKAFPPKNGIVLVSDSTNERFAMYKSANYSAGTLTGISEVPSKEGLGSGVTFADSVVALQPHVNITSVGKIGPADEPVIRTLNLSQPLLSVDTYVRRSFSTSFESEEDIKSNWLTVLDGEEISRYKDVRYTKYVSDEGNYNYGSNNGAMAVTANNQYYQAINNKTRSQIGRETIVALKHTDEEVAKLLALVRAWRSNGQMVLYDIQTKIAFTEWNDFGYNASAEEYIKDYNSNLSFGSWAFGVSFNMNNEQNEVVNNRLTTMYTVGFLNAYKGRSYNALFNTGSEIVVLDRAYFEWDGIYDSLHLDNGSNKLSDTDTQDWNDSPLINGIPYVALWQRSYEKVPATQNTVKEFYGAKLLSKYPIPQLTDKYFVLFKRLPDETGPEFIRYVFNTKQAAYNAIHSRYETTSLASMSNMDNYNRCELKGDLLETLWSIKPGKETDEFKYRTTKLSGVRSIAINKYRPAAPIPYAGYELKDVHNLLCENTYKGITILGSAFNYSRRITNNGEAYHTHRFNDHVLFTSTNGDIAEKRGYVLTGPISNTDGLDSSAASNSAATITAFSTVFSEWDVPDPNPAIRLAANHSYRYWVQPWVTINATVTEFMPKLGTDMRSKIASKSGKITVISAAFSSPSGNSSDEENIHPSGNKVKELGRTPYPRFQNGEKSYKWADSGDYFTVPKWEETKYSSLVWEGDSIFKNYSSETVSPDSKPGKALGLTKTKKMVLPAADPDNDFIYAVTGSFVTPDEGEDLGNIEVGLNALAIGQVNGTAETVYFDDFSMRVYEVNPNGFMPGVQQEN